MSLRCMAEECGDRAPWPRDRARTIGGPARVTGRPWEEGETKPRYGFSDFCMEIMDSSMILIQELLGYGLLGFHLDINLVPFSRVLLGKQSNSRFKGSLVEKP